jgi:hypothetical protein
MIQRRQELGLTLEPGQPFRVPGEFLRQDLDGHLSAEIPVEGAINLAHPALAELFLDLIMPGDNSPGGDNTCWRF